VGGVNVLEELGGFGRPAEPGGDPFVDLQVGDLALPADDQAYVALGYSGRCADSRLARSVVLDGEIEKPRHVTILEGLAAFIAVSGPWRNLDRIESVPVHSVLRPSVPKWCIAVGRDFIFSAVYLRGIGEESSSGHSFRHDNTS
jgi:hypothetical protein